MKFIDKKTQRKRFIQMSVIIVVLSLAAALFPYHMNVIQSVKTEAVYLKYKIAFASAENKNGNLLAAVGSFFQNIQNTKQSDGLAGDVPILLYHGIVKTPDAFSMTQDQFGQQMFALKNAGYHTITLAQFYDHQIHNTPLPAHSFLLTFDDGRLDSYYGADPILKAFGFHAVMFVATADSLDHQEKKSSYYLQVPELRAMIDSGRWELGSHAIQENTNGGFIDIDAQGTQGYFLSNKLWLKNENRLETNTEYTDRVKRELQTSKQKLESTLGITVIALSYPFSDYGEFTQNNPQATEVISKEMAVDYGVAFQQIRPGISADYTSNYVGDDVYHLKRIEVGPTWTGDYLAEYLASAENKSLPYVFDATQNPQESWVSTWGTSSWNTNGLLIQASSTTVGASVLLDGSRAWPNPYLLNTVVDLNNADAVSLIADYQDGNNYTSCVFTDNYVRINEKVHGVDEQLGKIKNTLDFPTSNLSLSMSVDENAITCYMGSQMMLSSFRNNKEKTNGGVGVEVWSGGDLGSAKITLKSARIVGIDAGKNILASLPQYPVLSGKKITTLVDVSKTSVNSNNDTPSLPPPKISLFNPDGEAVIKDFNSLPMELWKLSFGTLSTTSNSILIGSNASTTSSLSYFFGGFDWTDYKISTIVDWKRGSGFSLVARYQDSKNYAMCSFSNYGQHANIYVMKDNTQISYGQSPLLPVPAYAPWADIHFGIQVNGNEIQCLVNDQMVIKAQLPDDVAVGAVGFKTYDRTPGISQIIVKDFLVKPITR